MPLNKSTGNDREPIECMFEMNSCKWDDCNSICSTCECQPLDRLANRRQYYYYLEKMMDDEYRIICRDSCSERDRTTSVAGRENRDIERSPSIEDL